jgi:hypothetical protein
LTTVESIQGVGAADDRGSRGVAVDAERDE